MLIKTQHLNLKIGLFTAILASTLLLFSCSNERHFHKLHTYVQELKHTAATKNIKPTALPVSVPVAINYQAGNLRSPFEVTQALVNSKNINSTNPLLIYSIDMLKFVGTLFTENKSIAYILAPDNKLYHVSVGDMIGDHGGKVTQIFPNHIEIVEQSADNGKQATSHTVIMQLKEGTQ